MANSEECLLMENIQEYVNDENRIVTCKFLSLTLNVHINVAKQALCNFVSDERNKGGNDDVNVTYFVAGLGSTKSDQQVLKCVVVPENDLEAVKSTLSPVTSCHIYSVQKAKLKDYTALYQTDYEAIKENRDNLNKHTSITCPWATQQPERTFVKVNSKDSNSKQAKSEIKEGTSSPSLPSTKDSSAKSSNEKGKKQKTGQIASMFAAAGKRVKKEPPTSEPEKDSSSTKAKPKENKTGVMSFFKSQLEKPDEKQKNKEQTKRPDGKEKEKKEASESKSKAKDSKSSSSRKPKDVSDDAGPQRKRRRIRTDLFDSSDDENKEDLSDEEDNFSPQPEEMEPESVEKSDVEDNFVEEKDDDQTGKKITADDDDDDKKFVVEKRQDSGGRKRKRIRRLVPKQHIDDEGFMVTEKVWESDSTDASDVEDEEQNQAKSLSPKPPAKKVPRTPTKGPADSKKKGATAKVSPSKNKQTSLTSFFKKK